MLTKGLTLQEIIDYLYAEFQRRNGVDFYVHSKRLAKALGGTSTKKIGKQLGILATRGTITRHSEGIWKTCFSHKEEPKEIPIPKKRHWWNFKKKLS